MSRRLSDDDVAALRAYLRRTAGLELDETRRPGLSEVVRGRLAATGHADLGAYLRALDRPGGTAERQRLLDEVTIQETHFHRALPQIEALRRHLLPALLARAKADDRELVVWSAGCATGEEPFTLAMLLLEAAARMAAPPPFRVVGSDVSSAALEVARAATYSGRTVALAEPGAVARWLQRDVDGTHAVSDEVRAVVSLVHHNLVTDPPPFAPGTVDLVVCRHVTIYFSRETTKGVVGRFADVLTPDGWLLLGPTETLWRVSERFTTVPVGDAFAYRVALPRTARRPAAGSAHRPAPAPGRGGVAHVAAAAGRTATAGRPGGVAAPGPVLDPAAALAAAEAAFDAADYESAALLAAQLLAPGRGVPDRAQAGAFCLLGHVQLNRGDPASAVPPLQRAVYLDPAAGHAHFLLGVAHSALGKARPAAAAYRAAAGTLGALPDAQVRRILGGRGAAEAVQVCHRLADEAEVARVRRGA